MLRRVFKSTSILGLFFVISLSSCGGSGGDSESSSVLYARAVIDASEPLEEDVFDGLTAIVETNQDTIWQTFSDGPRVLVATWTSWNGYQDVLGESLELAVDVWVTAAPQVQEFCQQTSATEADLVVRLEQLLGLPQQDGKIMFVEMWVRPEDMFRPCKDPEITDSVCGLEFPAGVSDEHREWFENLVGESYGENAYPWTQLGYTYDWDPLTNKIGLSEFVVGKGASVIVALALETEEYCQ